MGSVISAIRDDREEAAMWWGAGATPGDTTRAAVVALLGRQGPLSRAEIAERLGLSPAAITQAVRRLLGQELVSELEQRPSQGGRPATPVGLVPGAGHALGVQVAHEHVSGVLTQLDATVVDHFHQPFDPAAPDAVDRLTELIGRQLDRAAQRGQPVLGVGVAVPGVVDPATGTLRMSVRLGWTGTPLAARLRAALGLPVLVDNDISAITAFERLYGPGADYRDFLLVAAGQGVGMGIVVDGAPYRGAAGAAGEFGHLPLIPDGLPCVCGNRGCLETVLSTESIARRAIELGVIDSVDLAALQAVAAAPHVRTLLAEAGTAFGRSLAGVVNLLGPQRVVVIGELVTLWPHVEPNFRAALRDSLLPSVAGIDIDVRPWDGSLIAMGAAGIVLTAPLAAPRQTQPT